jgi:hypothetical protein
MTDGLLVGQIALTIVLLVGAGLMIRSFLITQQFDIGVNAENLVTVQVTLPNTRYPQPTDRLAFQERVSERLRNVPGVDSVTIASQPPAAGGQMRTLKIEGRGMVDANNRLPNIARITVVPEYFESLDLSLRRGRGFNEADGAAGAEVVIINEVFAARYFPDSDPLGARLRLGGDLNRGTEDLTSPWLTIIGVSPSVFQMGPPDSQDLSIEPTVYTPFRQAPPPRVHGDCAHAPGGRRGRHRHPQRDSAARRRPAAVQHPHDGRAHGAAKLAVSNFRHAVRNIRRDRAADLVGRHLRIDRARRRPADAGARGTHGARRCTQ